MMTKKEKKKLLVVGLIIAIILIIIMFITLYFLTDMFKSNKTLFLKYLGENAENLETIIETLDNKNTIDSKYEESSEIKMNFIENVGTSLENADNAINNLKITIDSQNDKENKYNHKDIKILKNDENLSNIEYLQQENNYGIKFSDLFNQYLLVEKENIQQFLEKTELSQEQLDKIQKVIEEDENNTTTMKLTEEEIETLRDKYVKIINTNGSIGKFSKAKNQQIIINQKPVYVNAYTLTLTKEQLNNIYIKILEALKEDEIFLKRAEYLQTQVNKINILLDEPIDVKQNFISNIEKTIEDINRNNIGNDETKIIIYENAKRTVRTSIQTPEYQIDIDVFQNNGKFIEISKKENENEVKKITINDTQDELNINIEDNKSRESYKLNIERTKENGDNILVNISLQYEKNDYKFETRMAQTIKKVENFEKQITIAESNSIQLDKMKQEELDPMLEKVKENLNPEIDRIKQEVNIEDIQKLENMLGIKKNVNVIDNNGTITEAEKNRFNSKFQFLKTEELSNEEMLSAIKTFEENFIDFEIVSGTELKIEISRNNKNEERIKTLKDFVEEKKRLKYTLNVEYDETTGLVKYVTIKIITD